MALDKVTYVENVTKIHAQNLNDIQDEIIQNAANISLKYEIPEDGIPLDDIDPGAVATDEEVQAIIDGDSGEAEA